MVFGGYTYGPPAPGSLQVQENVATDADDATADRMWEYIAIAKSAELDSGKTSCLTALLLQEENQSLLECFRGEGQWHGHGAEAHFEGAPNWMVVLAKLESFSQHLSRKLIDEAQSLTGHRWREENVAPMQPLDDLFFLHLNQVCSCVCIKTCVCVCGD